jgi:catechol 2,3-dioxygenase-like lactoylglutathione lyase family enzyme
MVTMAQTIPALAVHAAAAAVDLYRDRLGFEVLHHDGVDMTDFGTREFATLELDGNLVTFFTWVGR